MKIPYPEFPREYYPGVSFMPATEKRVIIWAAPPGLDPDLKLGTVVTKIDGEDARKFLDERGTESWKKGGYFSSRQRARMFEYRTPLKGEKGEAHGITILADDGKEKELKVTSTIEARGWPHVYNLPEGLARVGRSCFHAELPGGFGYIYLRRVDRGIEKGIAQAIAAHPDVKGWVVDLRGNGGGGYGRALHEQLKLLRKPVACLIDPGCMSAGETLARDVVHFCDAKLFGSKTAGASSAKRIWNFPSGIGSVIIPRRSRWGIDRKPIEYHGIKPHVAVEAVPEEVREGKNSCILRAVEYLQKDAGQ
jgi:C-terminal processing protease CtpA/Prc